MSATVQKDKKHITVKEAAKKWRKTASDRMTVLALVAIVAGCAHTMAVPMRGDRPMAWKDIGSLSDAKKVEERYTMSVPPHLSPFGRLVPDIDIYKRMKEIRLASVSFRPPATLMDAVLFFQSASVPYDGSGEVILFAMRPAKTDEIYPPAPELAAEDISFYDVLKIVVESANAKFWIRDDGVVVVEPKSWTCSDGCKPGEIWLLDEGSWPKAADRESMGVSQNLNERN